MSTIRRLPDLLISQIAAGEVIERPASVVKELIENSLDSGANRIYINIENGGKDKIIVIDNGSGINSEELPLAIERHTTSKISELGDLENILTLGFRGEALASMASVSKLTIESSTDSSTGIGGKIRIHGGTIVLPLTEIGRTKGTTIVVEDLFYNIPARKKFLKGSRTETTYIVQMVSKFAIIHPHVQFVLEQKGKEYIRTIGNNNWLNTIGSIYGNSILEHMKPVNYEKENVMIRGFISTSDGAKKTRKQQLLSVNDRIVENKNLLKAIEDGSRHYIPPGIFPVAVISVNVSPNTIDVNAHPSKNEIRIIDEEFLIESIKESIDTTLQSYYQEQTLLIDEIEEHIEITNELEGDFNKDVLTINIIGQIKDTYIIAEIHNRLMIIDQHAAHEAINYHYLKEAVLYKRDTMPTIEPPNSIVIDITPSQEVNFKKHKIDIEKMGFEVEPFGLRTIIVRKVPKGIDMEKVKDAIEEILSDGTTMHNDWLKNSLISTSCKSAIKANQKLSEETMLNIVKSLILNQITNCPHGRPLFVSMPITDLEKKMKRIL